MTLDPAGVDDARKRGHIDAVVVSSDHRIAMASFSGVADSRPARGGVTWLRQRRLVRCAGASVALMDPGDSWPQVPPDVRNTVEVIVRSVIRPEELGPIVVGWSRRQQSSAPLEPKAIAVFDDEVMLWAWVTAAGETFRCPLWEPESAPIDEWICTFASQLEDSIAESKFAWGQERVVPRPFCDSPRSADTSEAHLDGPARGGWTHVGVPPVQEPPAAVEQLAIITNDNVPLSPEAGWLAWESARNSVDGRSEGQGFLGLRPLLGVLSKSKPR